VTLRTRELPAFFGEVRGTIAAHSEAAFRRLTAHVLAFYGERLFNPHWGEQIHFEPDNTVRIGMVFQGLTRAQAEEVWRPLLELVAETPQDLGWVSALSIVDLPARHVWDATYPGRGERVIAANRPGVHEGSFSWAGNADEAGQYLHAYHSLWLPASLLVEHERVVLADAIFAASRHWGISLHFNKALAGAPAPERAAARATAMNPAVADSFALCMIIASGPPAFPEIRGREPDLAAARRDAAAVERAWHEVRKVAPEGGSYVSESDFFEREWQEAFWGSNYARLLAIKRTYDPAGLFWVHHGVGSEDWSADGFTRDGPARVT
jgi:FAD/FMN-containing dehydrogenase